MPGAYTKTSSKSGVFSKENFLSGLGQGLFLELKLLCRIDFLA
jgi:hypothetical protein